jgi:hypothetical protein
MNTCIRIIHRPPITIAAPITHSILMQYQYSVQYVYCKEIGG